MSFLEQAEDIDTLIYTAGFGRVARFEDLTEEEMINSVKVNQLAAMRVIRHFYSKINSDKKFVCAVMGSIAGHIASPLFSVYGATKSALCAFIENINIELAAVGRSNRILDVSPGSLKGTKFSGGRNDMSLLSEIASEILDRAVNGECLFIPQPEIYENVIARSNADPMKFGLESYKYKTDNNRCSSKPQLRVGYLSGTFDLFHVGHLNLLVRAKQYCDCLIVGVHRSGSWKGKETFIPYDERVRIIESIKYVDKVIEAPDEDIDVYDTYNFNFLFVGSDYKGTERFERYESLLNPKGVKIVYFPYTTSTSSSQLRAAINTDITDKK